MADEPVKVNVQSRRVDSSILPNTFSQPYRLYIIQQNTDMLSIANAANNAGQLAYEATVKNEQQDAILEDHESRITGLRVEVDDHELRITANTNAISLLDVRLATAEGKIITLRSDVDYLLGEVINIESDMVSKSSTSNQTIQSGGGSFIIGNVPSPTSDKLQVLGSENVSVSYKVAGTQVVSTRKTGWTAATGTAYRGAFNADQTMPVGATYSQAEVQAIVNNLLPCLKRLKALEDDLRSHGLIN